MRESDIEGNFNVLGSNNRINGGNICGGKKHWEMSSFGEEDEIRNSALDLPNLHFPVDI